MKASKKHHIHGPTSKWEPKPLDEDMFYELFDILHDGCFEGNWSQTARVLCVGQRTIRNWSKQPPRGSWWNHILTQLINECYQSMVHSKHKKIRKRAEKIKGQLHRAGLHTLQDYLIWNEANNSDVQRALLVAINETDTQSMTLQELKKPAHLGAYSERAIRAAAESLGLVREVTGFGKEKIVTYRMPTSDDL